MYDDPCLVRRYGAFCVWRTGFQVNIHELARRYNVTTRTIHRYTEEGIIPKPVPPRGCTAAYGREHIEAMEAIWGRNGLKDTNRTLKELAEARMYAERGGIGLDA